MTELQGNRIFAKTCERYVQEICGTDFLARAEVLGLEIDKQSLIIPLYDEVYSFSSRGIEAHDGREVSSAVQVMICKYILTFSFPSLTSLDTSLVTYREFKDSGPLTSYFTSNTNKTIEVTFAGNIARLRERSRQIGGNIVDSSTYDLALQFFVFPRIPVFLNFNDQDDSFPAVCSVLYHASASQFLDMESLAMTGTLLTGKLLSLRLNL